MSQTETTGGLRMVALPESVLDRVENRLPYTEFDTSEAYVTYALEELLSQVVEVSDDDYEAAAEGEVESRLKSLGYLN